MQKFLAKNIFQDDLYSYLHNTDDINLQSHSHDFYEIFIVLDGSIEHEFDDCSKVISLGSCFLIYPDEAHCYKNPSENFLMLNIAVKQNTFESLITYLNLSLKRECLINKKDCMKILNRFEQTATVSKNLLLIIAQLFADSENSANIPLWLFDIHQDLRDNCNFIFGMKFVQKKCDKSLPHFSREFKKYYKISPIDYITDLRINYARRLLKSTALSVTEIALKCGYDNISHFNHVFKQKTSISPLIYRQNNSHFI